MRKKISVLLVALVLVSGLLYTAYGYHQTEDVETKVTSSTTINLIRVDAFQQIDSLSKNESKKEEKKEFIVDLTQEELETFYKLVFAEGGIESEDTQVAVAATIINRILSDSFSDNFYDVMNQSGAFSSVHNQEIYVMTANPYKVTLDMVPQETQNAVLRALRGEDPTEDALRQEAQRLGLDEEYYAEGGALYFYYPGACGAQALAKRENITVKVNIGYQYYYKVWD